MRMRIRRRNLGALVLVGLLTCWTAGTASAQEKTKSTQTEADWVAYDAAASTIEVKVRKPGKGPDAKKLKNKKNKNVVFNVKAEGSVLTRTTVAINGMKADLTDLPEGKRVFIYWRVADDGSFFARKIDAIMSEEEFDAKYGTD